MGEIKYVIPYAAPIQPTSTTLTPRLTAYRIEIVIIRELQKSPTKDKKNRIASWLCLFCIMGISFSLKKNVGNFGFSKETLKIIFCKNIHEVIEKMTRYFVTAYLDSFFTQDSGDIAGKGEFYFKCNKKRYPDVGFIQMKKGQTFDPEPNPVMYSAVLDDKTKEVKFDLEVWEEDPGMDDKFIDKNFHYPLRPTHETFELTDKKEKCKLKLVVKIEETEW